MSFLLSEVNEMPEEMPTLAQIERDLLRDQLIQKERELKEAARREKDLIYTCDELEEGKKILQENVHQLRDAHVLLTLEYVKLEKKIEEYEKEMTTSQKDQGHLDDHIEKSFAQLEQLYEGQKRILEFKTRRLQSIEEQTEQRRAKVHELEDKIYQMAVENNEASCRLEEAEKLLELVEKDLSYSHGRIVDLGNELHRAEKEKRDIAAELQQARQVIMDMQM